MSLLRVNDLLVCYPGLAAPVVDELSFAVEAGEALGLVGESGSGKTQTALAVMGLLPPQAAVSGSIRFDGTELRGKEQAILNRFRARRLSMVFQDPKQALNPFMKVGEQLRRLVLEHDIAAARQAKPVALHWLSKVRLSSGEYDAYPHQLSGGMRQRVMIALALCCGPELLIADEPTTALDVTVQAELLDLLQELRRETGIALLLITHDLAVIAENCERLLVMHRGRLLEQGPTRTVFESPQDPVTRGMLRAAKSGPPPPAISAVARGTTPLLRVDDVSVSFRSARRRGSTTRGAVAGVSFSLEPGETLAVVGESGSGKTTLARAIAGLQPPDRGSVQLAGAGLAARAQERPRRARLDLQMVFQDPVASLNPAHRVEGILDEAIALSKPRPAGGARRELAIAALERVGLEAALLRRFPHELSGGQAQRVAIARTLVAEPRVLVCDEALAALDGTVRRSILDLLQAEQQRTGLALLFISHDLSVVRQISHRVMVMYRGRVCELTDSAGLFRSPGHPYTRRLLESVPIADPERYPRRLRPAETTDRAAESASAHR